MSDPSVGLTDFFKLTNEDGKGYNGSISLRISFKKKELNQIIVSKDLPPPEKLPASKIRIKVCEWKDFQNDIRHPSVKIFIPPILDNIIQTKKITDTNQKSLVWNEQHVLNFQGSVLEGSYSQDIIKFEIWEEKATTFSHVDTLVGVGEVPLQVIFRENKLVEDWYVITASGKDVENKNYDIKNIGMIKLGVEISTTKEEDSSEKKVTEVISSKTQEFLESINREGCVGVNLLEVRNLPDMDTFGGCDPYCEIYLLPKNKDEIQITKHIKGVKSSATFKKEHNNELKLKYHGAIDNQAPSIQVNVMDYDATSAADMIGKTTISLDSLFVLSDIKFGFEGWFSLINEDGSKRGEVKLKIYFEEDEKIINGSKFPSKKKYPPSLSGTVELIAESCSSLQVPSFGVKLKPFVKA